MNMLVDRETRITGIGRTPEEALASMNFYIERSGRLSTERIQRRKEIHAWLPRPNLLHVKNVCAIQYDGTYFINLKTGRKVHVKVKPLAHYLCLYSAFDGELSFEDFTLTIAPEVNKFLSNISSKFLSLNDFPYVKPVENLEIKYYHETKIQSLSLIETVNDTIVVKYEDELKEVDKTPGVTSDCLLAYLLATIDFEYDGTHMRRLHAN